MNTRIVKIMLSVGLFVMMTGIAVNAQETRLMADIPFEFNFGEKVMPAGEYDLEKLNLGMGAFRLCDEKGKHAGAKLVVPIDHWAIPTESVLVFNRYRGNGGEVSHFLAQVWYKGSERGYEFYRGKAEQAAALRAARRDMITLVVRPVKRGTE